MAYTYNGTLFCFKREEILIHATPWMTLEDSTPSETSQSQKDTHFIIPLCEVPIVVTFPEMESGMLAAKGRGKGRVENYY